MPSKDLEKNKKKAAERFGRDASAAEWEAERQEGFVIERRRRERILKRGVEPRDVKELVIRAREMCGGIGPYGEALDGTFELIGRKLVQLVSKDKKARRTVP